MPHYEKLREGDRDENKKICVHLFQNQFKNLWWRDQLQSNSSFEEAGREIQKK